MKKTTILPLFILSFLLLSSCMSTKKVAYFQDKDAVVNPLYLQLYDAKIMPKDILMIQVFTMTPEAAEPFNLTGSVTNYLVDNDGNIYFPIIGKIHLGGMTKNQAEAFIKSKISPYMSATEDFSVHVRMSNYKYAVLGEVNRPGMFTTQNEKINIVEAIAQAGDLTLYGERDKVFLIREDSLGHKEYHQLSFNDANIVNSPYYYLQQNDIIYVEPNKSKARSAYFSTATSMWFTITSMLMSVTTFIIALSK